MKNHWIVILSIFAFSGNFSAFGQSSFLGEIRDETNNMPLGGAEIKSLATFSKTVSDMNGIFNISVDNKKDTLQISLIGYKTILRTLPIEDDARIFYLEPISTELDVVEINTGYYKLPKERVTGSFVQIDNDLVNRGVGHDIIGRLEGITNSLAFIRSPSLKEGDRTPSLRIRGLSTLHSYSEPLIVLDNFPYEGDLNSINPNDVESITILKDAAAASIWGARAGNGVIVINTKKGSGKNKIGFVSTFTLREKPDLFYNRDYLASSETLEVERFLFDKKIYAENDWTILSPAIELLIKERDKLISTEELNRSLDYLTKQDIRKEALNTLYREGIMQQYALNFSGGTKNYNYYLSAGFDSNKENIIGNGFERVTLTSRTFYTIKDNIRFDASINFSQANTQNNGIGISNLVASGSAGTFPYPYTKLMDKNGEPLAINRKNRMAYNESALDQGLLDWSYKPLEERGMVDKGQKDQDFRIGTGITVDLLKGFNIEARYQYQLSNAESKSFYDKNSFYSRDLVNQYTQADMTKVIPEGAIIEGQSNKSVAHYGRMQLNYEASFKEKHSLYALGGAEIRQKVNSSNPGYRVYDYDNEVISGTARFNYDARYNLRPRNSATLPAPPSSFTHITDRFLSYYGNASYSFKNKYTASFSSRWDASNLFGVRTNQKGVPLWSTGILWEVNKEPFYNIDALSYLRLRATYGSNGNINQLLSSYPIVAYSRDAYSDLPIGIIQSIGNPELRWEKINTVNFGIDFAALNNRVNGSLEYYEKNGSDLIGEDFLAPSTGIYNTGVLYNMINLVNYANIKTKGMDIELNTINTKGELKWRTGLLVNIVTNKVTNYKANENQNIRNYFTLNNAPVVVGNSKDALYSLPWNGLNSENGDPIAIKNGETFTNYSLYINSFKEEELLNVGVSIPPYFGSIRNDLSWNGISLSANITWAAGFKFKRSSIFYESLFNNAAGHSDFIKRWQKPGDEKHTDVPSMPDKTVANRDFVYSNSEILFENGNHIRLQDINIGFDLNNLVKKFPIPNSHFFLNVNNVGIIWRANDYKIDPLYPFSEYPPSRTFSLRFQTTF